MRRISFELFAEKKMKFLFVLSAFLTIFFISPIFADTIKHSALEKKDLLEFVEIIQNKPLREKVKMARLLFSKEKELPSNYRWVFKDYKVDSHDGILEYIFLDEEAFGNIRWKIEMHVQEATSKIIFFEADALKNS